MSEGTSSASNGDKHSCWVLLWRAKLNQNQKLASEITAPMFAEKSVIVLECYFVYVYSAGDGLNSDVSAENEVKWGSF